MFDLVGSVGQVPSMTASFKPATKPVSELRETARASREAIMTGVKGSGDGEVDAEVHNKTLDERADSWLSGPIAWEDLPEHAVVNRRFGIRQGAKIRLIDDFSGSGENSCAQTLHATRRQQHSHIRVHEDIL